MNSQRFTACSRASDVLPELLRHLPGLEELELSHDDVEPACHVMTSGWSALPSGLALRRVVGAIALPRGARDALRAACAGISIEL